MENADSDLAGDISAFEDGQLSDDEVIDLFQRLIDSGIVWRLQGSYGRQAMQLIQSGRCMLGPEGHRDAWGNYVPSRFEIKPGTVGSSEYVDERDTSD